MGYEVLDARGAQGPGAGQRPAVDIVHLDDVPPEVPATDSVQVRLAGVWRRRLELLVPVAVALVVGGLLGGFVSGQRAAASERSARRSELAVIAQVESSTLSEQRGVVEAELGARVINSGPEPIELLVSPEGTSPDSDQPVVVTQGSGSSRLAAGTDSTVRLQVLLACGRLDQPDLALTVRTADGRPHAVALRPSNNGAASPMTALCSNAEQSAPSVSAMLRGTASRPVLVIRNDRDSSVRVALGTDADSGPDDIAGLLSITTTPALPVVVRAHQQVGVAVHARVSRCVEDLDVLPQFSAVSAPALNVSDPNGQVLQNGSAGDGAQSVDMTALVNRAVALACR